ncbi:MAG: BMP family ABC transporter substrate-binding protein [Sphaerochaetaceae bacterium]
MKKIIAFFVAAILSAAALFSGGQKEADDGFSVLVYVTGITAGSPSYELMVQGAQDFAAEHEEVSLKIYEAGYNQAEWKSQLSDLVASGSYDVAVASNPAMTDICQEVAEQFPDQKFIITDAYLDGNAQITTYLFNQYEQMLALGYLAGLITISKMEKANSRKVIGFIAAQEYPLLNKHLVPGFLDGARLADPDIQLDFRVIGNWYDAAKCGELAASMMASGVDVFTSIAGGAEAGLLQTAQTKGAYIVHPNISIYSTAPEIVAGCGIMGQRELVKHALQEALSGTMEYGKAYVVGMQEGYVDFDDADPLFGKALDNDVKTGFTTFLSNLRSGRVKYTLPQL